LVVILLSKGIVSIIRGIFTGWLVVSPPQSCKLIVARRTIDTLTMPAIL
jgi:hypothetical protein